MFSAKYEMNYYRGVGHDEGRSTKELQSKRKGLVVSCSSRYLSSN